MKQYGMFTDAGDRKIDELVNSEDFPTMSLDEVEKKLEALTRLTGSEIEPEPSSDLLDCWVSGKYTKTSAMRLNVRPLMEASQSSSPLRKRLTPTYVRGSTLSGGRV